jgi:hypothetical protein
MSGVVPWKREKCYEYEILSNAQKCYEYEIIYDLDSLYEKCTYLSVEIAAEFSHV